MKRGWKFFWIISAGLILVGFVCCIIAFSLGASFADVTDRYYSFGSSSGSTATSEEFSNIDELNINVSGNLNIITENRETILVEITEGGKRWDTTCRQEGSELIIKTKTWFNWLGSINYGTVNIYVPEGYQFEEADISLGVGESEIEEINAKELKVEAGAGRAVLNDFVTDELKMDCGVGDLEADGTLNGDAKIVGGVGKLALGITGRESDFNYDINCGVGSVSIGDGSYSGLGYDKKIQNDSDKTIKIDCGVGSVDVKFN